MVNGGLSGGRLSEGVGGGSSPTNARRIAFLVGVPCARPRGASVISHTACAAAARVASSHGPTLKILRRFFPCLSRYHRIARARMTGAGIVANVAAPHPPRRLAAQCHHKGLRQRRDLSLEIAVDAKILNLSRHRPAGFLGRAFDCVGEPCPAPPQVGIDLGRQGRLTLTLGSIRF